MSGMTLEAPGYEVGELIGFGGSGEVWRARDLATGEVVALKRLRASVDHPAGRDQVRREAARLAQLGGPHVVPLRGVLSTPGGPVLVLDYAAGGSLAALRAARPRLEPGELVTIGLPLARTLASLHSRDVVHGGLSPSNVLFTADGRPMIADLGVSRLVGEAAGPTEGSDGYADPAVLAGGPVTAASDGYALSVLLVECLTGEPFQRSARERLSEVAPPRLAAALSAALSSDPRSRPSLDELAAALRELGPAAPVGLDRALAGAAVTSSAPAATPPAALGSPRARAWLPGWRPVLGLGAVAGLVAAAVLVGLLLSRGAAPEAAIATPLPAPPVNWTAVMTELDAARDDAFLAGDPDALAAAYLPGSAALRIESERLRALLDERLVVRGLELVLLRVEPRRVEAGRAVLAVTDRMPAYDLLDAAGRLVAHRPARAARTWRVELAKVGHGWRIAAVLSAG